MPLADNHTDSVGRNVLCVVVDPVDVEFVTNEIAEHLRGSQAHGVPLFFFKAHERESFGRPHYSSQWAGSRP